MTQEQKVKLLKFLYSNEQTFLCNDLFQELLNIVPKTKCICSRNIVDKTRYDNYIEVFTFIKQFLDRNSDYKSIVLKIFSSYEEQELINHLIVGYVFYLAMLDNKDLDIFKDKRSICYTEGPSIVDILF